MKGFLSSLYVSRRVWVALGAFVLAFVAAFAVPGLFALVRLGLAVFGLLVVLDGLLLFRPQSGLFARRDVPDRMSNGDDNPVAIYLENRYPFAVDLEVIDEIPFQFQRRDVLFRAYLTVNQSRTIHYTLRPVRRGEYLFGTINAYVLSPLRLLKRRYQFSQNRAVAVYPSFLQMRQYELLALSNRLTDVGIKRLRRLGHSMEFEQIRPYVAGDDVRTLNWKATARRSDAQGAALMVNAYQDERAQAVYCLLDKGRTMRSPFDGMTLLDHAINASLVLSNIALLQQDRAGLFTFAHRPGQFVAADRRAGQLRRLLDVLYRQKTRFLETDYEALYASVRANIRQRSLLLLFTNFETSSALHRQLPFLRRMAKDHLLLVVLFENTELRTLLDAPAHSTEAIYQKTIAEKFFYEKKLIQKELRQHGIQALLTAPQHLTANTVNKYLELKARGMI